MLPDTHFLESTLGTPLGLHLRMRMASGPVREENLSTPARLRFESVKGTPRESAWLLGRRALETLHTEVGDCPDIETLEFPNPRFSLTHSADVALAVADTSGALGGIGIDLEMGTRIQAAAARFFLTRREQDWVQRQPAGRRSHHLLRLWCVKEAVFKANPENPGTVLGDHELLEPADSCGKARAATGRTMEYTSWCESRTCVALAVCR